jgi:hypothetical protein
MFKDLTVQTYVQSVRKRIFDVLMTLTTKHREELLTLKEVRHIT